MVPPVLYIVIPCYNEEEVLPTTSGMFLKKIQDLVSAGKIAESSRILFVNDGSKDRTWEIITDLSHQDPHFQGIAQSRNRGHQNAVLAGLMECMDRCDITISIDCDGQDDIDAMDKMVDAYLDGCEIVYGVRAARSTDSFFKRFTAESFYKLLNSMGAEVVFNHADYRLMSSRALHEFAKFKEVNLYLRGMVPLVGFRSTCVSYDRHERIAGKSHYPLSKMIGLAFDGITSLSVKPIRLITLFGMLVSMISFIGIIWVLITALTGHSVAGWASMVCIVCFMGGIQSMFLGVIGEYVGKIYLETKARPRYIMCKFPADAFVDLSLPFLFVGKTDHELSVVLPSAAVPDSVLQREDDWKAFRFAGSLDFSLIGILARVSSVLAEHGISIFALSTFDTDYILLKKEHFSKALDLLKAEGYSIQPA